MHPGKQRTDLIDQTAPVFDGLRLQLERNSERDRGAFAQFAVLDPDLSAHQVDEFATDRQSESGSAEATRR